MPNDYKQAMPKLQKITERWEMCWMIVFHCHIDHCQFQSLIFYYFLLFSSLPPSLQLQCSSVSAWNVVDNAIPSSRHIMMSLYNEQDKFLIRRRPSYPLRFVLLLKRYLSTETTWRMIEMMKKVATAAEVDSEGAWNNEEGRKEGILPAAVFFSFFFLRQSALPHRLKAKAWHS